MPATKQPLEAFQKGFESTPGNQCSLVTLNDQNDVGAAKEAALQAMSNGADILTANANLAGTGVWQAVAAQGGDKVFAVGTISDVNSQAPKNMLFSAGNDLSASILAIVKSIKDGTVARGQAISIHLSTPGGPAVYPIIWNPNIDASVMTPALKQELQDDLSKIASGSLQVPAVQ